MDILTYLFLTPADDANPMLSGASVHIPKVPYGFLLLSRTGADWLSVVGSRLRQREYHSRRRII